jgi:hypothetical protein
MTFFPFPPFYPHLKTQPFIGLRWALGLKSHEFFNQHSSLSGFGLGLLDGHPVIYAFYTPNISHDSFMPYGPSP